MCPDNKRDRPTLEKIILDNVEQGPTIYTDGWKAYANLEAKGYKWDYVNYSEEFTKYNYDYANMITQNR